MGGVHSILAPSDASRWMRCVGSLHLSRGLPDVDAEYNASGGCSHWLLEWTLTHPELELDSWLGKTMTFGENPPFNFVIDEARLDRVRACADAVNREPGMMFTERRLDVAPVVGVPGQEGHSDIIKAYPEGAVVKDERLLRGVLSVHDFKDGWILVHAKDNLQGLLYLCAAMFEFEVLGTFEAFRFVIHQPKIHHYDEWTYTRQELEAFMTLVRPVAKLAYDLYYGTQPFDPKAHLVAGEDQCLFCPVRGRCPARAARIVSMFEPLVQRHELDDRSVGLLYGRLDEIESAIRDFRIEALRRAKMGSRIEGYKLAYGNHGKREWIDPEAAAAVLETSLGDAAYAPRVPVSPTVAERMLKKAYAPLAALVTRADPTLRLVPVDHTSPEVKMPEFQPVPENAEPLI